MRWWILASAIVPVLAFSIGCMLPACGCGEDVELTESSEWDAFLDETGETGDTGELGETGDTGDTGSS